MSEKVQGEDYKPSRGLDPSKGGKARAEKLTPEEREEIARRAAEARWGTDLPQATHGSPDHPLRIGDLEIPCYVLGDGRRVLHQRGMVNALGMSRGSSGSTGGDRLAKFAAGDRLKPYVSKELIEVTEKPIRFRTPTNQLAYGYEATVLADLCEAVLAARADDVLQKQQEHIAKQCEILVRGFARVGIIALVDEATGYQNYRTRRALEEILEQFIAKELLKWAKMFPDEFYEEMFRLKSWQYRQLSSRRPIQAGKLTNDVVYERLAPGVLEELKRITPRDDKGRLKHRYHQRLTEDVGHPRLREHLKAVIALMRAFDDWSSFYRALNRSLPKQVQMPLLDWAESGKNTEAGEEENLAEVPAGS
ncbi:MAG TPA: P63C domain-containing protein [Gemmataceae bacterium]